MTQSPFGAYEPGNSFLHRLNPLVKLFGSVLLIACILFAERWIDLGGLLLLLLLVAVAAKTRLIELVRSGLTLKYFILITIAIHLLVGSISLSRSRASSILFSSAGLITGLLFGAKILLMAMFISVVMKTTHPGEITRSMSGIIPQGAGFGNVLSKLGLIFSLSIRFLPLILGEANRIRRAQAGRGLEITGGPIKRAKSLIPLVLPLVSSSLDRAEGVTAAMISRGYDLSAKRSVYRPRGFSYRDPLALIVIVGVVMLITSV